jgi:hypothetical protein
MHVGRYDEAEKSISEAIAIRKRLIAADPNNEEEKRDLRRAEGFLEQVRRRRGRIG